MYDGELLRHPSLSLLTLCVSVLSTQEALMCSSPAKNKNFRATMHNALMSGLVSGREFGWGQGSLSLSDCLIRSMLLVHFPQLMCVGTAPQSHMQAQLRQQAFDVWQGDVASLWGNMYCLAVSPSELGTCQFCIFLQRVQVRCCYCPLLWLSLVTSCQVLRQPLLKVENNDCRMALSGSSSCV